MTPPTSEPLIAARGLCLSAGKKPLLRELSCTLAAGEVLVVLGRSGAGKSLLLRAIAGFLPEGVRQTGGRVERTVKGTGAIRWLAQEPDAAFSPYHRASRQLLAGKPQVSPQEQATRFHAYCQELALAPDLAQAFPHELSGGERARLALAAALSAKPQVLLADEPSAAIDLATVADLLTVLRRATQNEGLALILVTHDFGVAHGLSKDGTNVRALVLEAGSLVAQDSLAALAHRPQASVQALIKATTTAPETPRQTSSQPTSTTTRKTETNPDILQASGLTISLAPTAHSRQAKAKTKQLLAAELSLHRGKTTALIGASGSGKSLLARTVGGLSAWRDSKTRLVVQGELATSNLRASAACPVPRAWHGQVQYVAQDPWRSLHPRRRVAAILREGASNFSLPKSATRIAELLEELELPAAYAQRFPHQLSGGERQRVALARALAVSPHFILADEITSALDSVSAARVLSVLARLAQENGLGVLLVTHDLRQVAGRAQEVQILEAGKVVESGTAAQVLQTPQSRAGQKLCAAAQAVAW